MVRKKKKIKKEIFIFFLILRITEDKSRIWIRIRMAKKPTYTGTTDPDPGHCWTLLLFPPASLLNKNDKLRFQIDLDLHGPRRLLLNDRHLAESPPFSVQEEIILLQILTITTREVQVQNFTYFQKLRTKSTKPVSKYLQNARRVS
jgi:hypothetical protein